MGFKFFATLAVLAMSATALDIGQTEQQQPRILGQTEQILGQDGASDMKELANAAKPIDEKNLEGRMLRAENDLADLTAYTKTWQYKLGLKKSSLNALKEHTGDMEERLLRAEKGVADLTDNTRGWLSTLGLKDVLKNKK